LITITKRVFKKPEKEEKGYQLGKEIKQRENVLG